MVFRRATGITNVSVVMGRNALDESDNKSRDAERALCRKHGRQA
jgi:hypothetical protein